MKKFITFLLICALMLACLISLGACTDGDEEETGHNIIIGGPEDEGGDPSTPDGGTAGDEWELGGVPLG